MSANTQTLSEVKSQPFSNSEAAEHLENLNDLYTRFMDQAVNQEFKPAYVNEITGTFVALRDLLRDNVKASK